MSISRIERENAFTKYLCGWDKGDKDTGDLTISPCVEY